MSLKQNDKIAENNFENKMEEEKITFKDWLKGIGIAIVFYVFVISLIWICGDIFIKATKRNYLLKEHQQMELELKRSEWAKNTAETIKVFCGNSNYWMNRYTFTWGCNK